MKFVINLQIGTHLDSLVKFQILNQIQRVQRANLYQRITMFNKKLAVMNSQRMALLFSATYLEPTSSGKVRGEISDGTKGKNVENSSEKWSH